MSEIRGVSVLAGLGWLGWAAGKIWPERISRKEVTSDSRGLAHCYSCFCWNRGNLCNDIPRYRVDIFNP